MIDIKNFCMHTIDIENKIFLRKNFTSEKKDFSLYLNTLINEILLNEKGRSYSFVSDTEEVFSCINEILKGGDWEILSEKIASKLNRCEIEKQEKVSGIATLKKGNLIQVIGAKDDKIICVLTKVENDPYIDEDSLDLSSGLPVKKNRVQKSCYIEFDKKTSFMEMILSDSLPKISEYWWSSFLASIPVIESLENTKKAYLAIDDLLKRKIKSKSDTDYWYLRNDINSYFSNKEAFLFNEVVEIFESYKADNEDVKEFLPVFIEELKKLPRTKKFDTQFDLDTKDISARLKRKIVLDPNIELRITGGIADIKEKIIPDKDEKGVFIKIYSKEGYNAFKNE
ncbi:hypothetical protein F959_02906 [Acinetobacter venetianus RAG-1 = CIP 110063]|uniref:37-kD nucleoid-associated bacterial protein n=1 Tax=Acinetobacter venetianus (strain ATCC 31012 / DSM 23050 / BCRC 14357 / CCUG 45561 / CIP 110063 / KCTC 2702 / LMG 19082 / RAG-1) TaxID=1191460 RepID=N8YI43_ACIVR|nr:hypothetical protein [Acinetobacter venetianus]ENV36376.1 hypothetical protein F959_02906 [Acinetobacter venetianus RAG-1 = CIP 110063]